MVMSMLGVRLFQDAPPLEVAIVVVIAALMVWALWLGARSGKSPPPGRDRAGGADSPSA